MITLRLALMNLGYWIRPFDMLADRRRWRWQKRTPCGRQHLQQMSAEDLAALTEAVQRYHENGGAA